MNNSKGSPETTDSSFPVLAEGFPFILISLAVGAVLLILPSCIAMSFLLVCLFKILGAVWTIFALFCVFFFRNPPIHITQDEGVILSPCNGTVLEIEETENEKIIRTFLSVLSVHLQRSPVAGKVKSVEYKKGKFLAAWNPQAHVLNEQNIITIESDEGVFVVRQIAGFLARRCVSRVKAGDELVRGKIIGLIKFSSQVDLHLPPDVQIASKPGDKVRAGITVVGELK